MIGADSETRRFTTYVQAPKPVVFTLYSDEDQWHGEEMPLWLEDLAKNAPDWCYVEREGSQWWAALTGAGMVYVPRLMEEHVTCWHHAAFDLCVLAEHVPGGLHRAFEALRSLKVYCTKVREQLLSIASGGFKTHHKRRGYFTLDGCSERYLGAGLEGKYGPDAWRTRYHELEGTPFRDWPQAAKSYALMDAKACFDVYGAQGHQVVRDMQTGAVVVDEYGGVTDEIRQTRAAFCLQLMACEGVNLDPKACAQTIVEWQRIAKQGQDIGRAAGFIKANGSKDMKALRAHVEAAYARRGLVPGTTESGLISTDETTLANSGDASLEAYAEASRYIGYLSKFAPSLTSWLPGGVGSSPNVLVETGRTSWSRPARQQPPRKGAYRECHIPKPGYLIVSCDYSQIEMVALAYVLEELGFGSDLADDIRQGVDLHCAMAQAIGNSDLDAYPPPAGRARWDYDLVLACRRGEHGDAAKKLVNGTLRQMAKAINFGAPGGLGAATLCTFAKAAYGLDMDADQAKKLLAVYKELRPSMANYYRHMSDLSESYGDFTVVQVGSNRVRGGNSYCSGCNTYFQGLAADGLKDAMWDVALECYLDKSSALYGSRPWLAIHDELLVYVPEPVASEAADRLSELMVRAMKRLIPNIPVEAPPALMDRWYKEADEVRDESGKLLVWRP